MAGFVDGEGCITICRQTRKNRPSPSYRAYITINNTKRHSLGSFLQEYHGGIYNQNEYRKTKDNVEWADPYTWYCPVSSSERFLTDLLPYLRIKGEQAKTVLEFIRTKNAFDRPKREKRKGGSSPLTEREIEYRESLRVKVHSLNKRGKHLV